MNQSAYRRAVSGIRWSDAQRQSIEARLRESVKPADCVDDGTEEFYETDILSMEDVRYGEEKAMTHKASRKLIWVAAAAAAALAVGGTTAAVAMRKGGLTESSDITDQLEPVSNLNLNLTDDEFIQAGYIRFNDPVEVSENGWYYFKQHDVNKSEEQWQDPDFDDAKYDAYRQSHEFAAQYYKDAETGEEAVLCARANCLHNGDDFCPASTNLYERSVLRYYDGALYAFALKRDRIDENGLIYYGKDYYLLRYEPDGTGITELARFAFNNGEMGTLLAPVIHRGYVFGVFYHVTEEGEAVENPITGNVMSNKTGGYVIAGYELASGKTVTIYSSLPESGSGYTYTAPEFLTAGGDYLYYSIPSYVGWPSENEGGIYSIDLRTGEHKKLALEGEYIEKICAAGDLLLYRSEKTSTVTWYFWNSKTGESTELSSFNTILTSNREGYLQNAVTDGTYIYAERLSFDGTTILSDIEIYDMEMNLLSKTEYGERVHIGDLMVQKGYLYAEVTGTEELLEGGGWNIHSGDTHDLYRCSVEDLLNGRADWKYVLTTTEREVYSDAE